MDGDFNKEAASFGKFRSSAAQLAKLLGNIERLRLNDRPLMPADKEKIDAEIKTRVNQVKKFKRAGVVPDVGVVVFAQIDLNKDRTISKVELQRMLKSLKHVYANDDAALAKMMEVLDSDKSGEVDEQEWLSNL